MVFYNLCMFTVFIQNVFLWKRVRLSDFPLQIHCAELHQQEGRGSKARGERVQNKNTRPAVRERPLEGRKLHQQTEVCFLSPRESREFVFREKSGSVIVDGFLRRLSDAILARLPSRSALSRWD